MNLNKKDSINMPLSTGSSQIGFERSYNFNINIGRRNILNASTTDKIKINDLFQTRQNFNVSSPVSKKNLLSDTNPHSQTMS